MRSALRSVRDAVAAIATVLPALASVQPSDGAYYATSSNATAYHAAVNGCRGGGYAVRVLSQECTVGQSDVRVAASVDARGQLHAAAWIDAPLSGERTYAWANVQFGDRLTFTGDVLPSAVRFRLFLHGLLSDHSSASLRFVGPSSGGEGGGAGRWLDLHGSELYTGEGRVWSTVTVPVVGNTLAFGFVLEAFAMMPELECDGPCWYPGWMRRAAFADMSQTAGIEFFEGLDASGQAIASGLRVASAAGHAYDVQGGVMASTTTPEPATVALLGAGLAAVGAAARRRRRVTGA